MSKRSPYFGTVGAMGQGPDQKAIRALILEIWNDLLKCGDVSDQTTFFEAGGTSLHLIKAHKALQDRLGTALAPTLIFEKPRLGDLSREIAKILRPEDAADTAPAEATADQDTSKDIAIIGYAARLPGAKDLDAFWQHQLAGTNLIHRFSDDELEDDPLGPRRSNKAYVPARPILDDVEMFDAKFFGIMPAEAKLMDPQARLFLEMCVEALDAAAIDPARPSGDIGVFGGATASTYLLHNLMGDRAALEEFTNGFQLDNYTTFTGNIADTLAMRAAFKLDLKGPAYTVSTACSTSLTAIAQAVHALRSGQCAWLWRAVCRSPSHSGAAILGKTAQWRRPMDCAAPLMQMQVARCLAMAAGLSR